jgi:hypothetical protein
MFDWVLDDIWDGWNTRSIDWKNVATLTVAVLAIAVSAMFSRRTLRLFANQLEQARNSSLT